jgi:hypothetical protein
MTPFTGGAVAPMKTDLKYGDLAGTYLLKR